MIFIFSIVLEIYVDPSRTIAGIYVSILGYVLEPFGECPENLFGYCRDF